MDTNFKNSTAWLKEYTLGVDIRAIPELSFSEMSSESIKAKSLVMFAESSGALAVVVSFKKSKNMIVVPLSQYTNPAMDLEILLPKSGLVACTWNARILRQDEAGEILALGIIEDEDFGVLENHYLAVHQGASLRRDFSGFVGASLDSMNEADKTLVFEYMQGECEQFEKDTFTALASSLSDVFQEEMEFNAFFEEELEDEDEDAIIFPGFGIESADFQLRTAASKNLDFSDDRKNKDDAESDDNPKDEDS